MGIIRQSMYKDHLQNVLQMHLFAWSKRNIFSQTKMASMTITIAFVVTRHFRRKLGTTKAPKNNNNNSTHIIHEK